MKNGNQTRRRAGRFFPGFLLLLTVCAGGFAADEFSIAKEGKSLTRIVTGKNPCPTSLHMAGTLSEMLKRICGASYPIEEGDGKTGIVVGMASEFPALANDPELRLQERFSPSDLATRQSYILYSDRNGIRIIGKTEIGVVYGVWDFLYRLGYRQFFPGTLWEIAPNQPTLSLTVDTFEKPDFMERDIHGSVTPDWSLKNRTSVVGGNKDSGLDYIPKCWQEPLIRNQHNWGSIIAFAQTEFDAHPEYMGLVTVPDEEKAPAAPVIGGKEPDVNNAAIEKELAGPAPAADEKKKTIQKRASTKICVSNPKVREIAVRYAIDYFSKNPEATSLSMEPSDGSGWCECDECAKIGQPAERVIFLANTVAEALEKDFPDKYLGVLAYHLHADAPTRKTHPRVTVSLTTHLSGKTPFDQRLNDWSKVCSNLGVYEYLSVFEWHLGLPAKSYAGNVPYLKQSVPSFHERGVRFYIGQAAGAAWGAHGFGYYLLSRIFWNAKEADRADEIFNDFLTKTFGKAAEAMRAYYEVIDGSQAKPGTGAFFLDRAKRMYDALGKAKQVNTDPVINERINCLVLYTRYVELFGLQAEAKGIGKWAITEKMVRHVYRMRDKGMVDYGWVRGFAANAQKVELHPDSEKKEYEKKLENTAPFVFEADKPFTEQEILDFIKGKAGNPGDKYSIKPEATELLLPDE